jgi:hypothetical protein
MTAILLFATSRLALLAAAVVRPRVLFAAA